MHRRRKEDSDIDSLVITTDDGTQLRCSIAAVGRETQPRWAVFDSRANQYVGPVVDADRSPDAVRHLITAWWATNPQPVGGARPRKDKEPRT
jgi:alcohol dehydrogenase class IV